MTRVTITIFGLAFIVLLCGAASATQINVNTANNWWGTNNETRINASTYGQTYHTSYGKVTTSPGLDGSTSCAPVPELPTIALLAVGLLMLAGYVRIERKKDE